jgi:hypothetical protein
MIEILKFEMINKGALVARFNVKMHKWGGLLIKECTLFEANGKKWVTLPSRQYEVEGKKKYMPYLQYEEQAMNDKFREMIMNAAEEYRSKFKAEEPQKAQYDDIPF